MNSRMWLVLTLLMAAVVTGAVSSEADSPETVADRGSATPNISVPTTGFDFGTVVDGTQVVHEFVIRNTGDAPLRVKQIRTG